MTASHDTDAYELFLNKHVKVVYREFSAPQIGKGVLIKIDSENIVLKGDFSRQLIPRNSIIKVSEMFNHEVHDEGQTKRLGR